MANNTTTQEVKELTVDARFLMRSYEQVKDGKKEIREYLSFELINPFGDDEMLQDVPLKARWDKFDEKTGRVVRVDRVFGYMQYYAKKALRTAAEVRVKVTIKPVKYKSKHSGEMVVYPAIYADPTFMEIADERPPQLIVKGAEALNMFEFLASRALGIKFIPDRNIDDEDVGL